MPQKNPDAPEKRTRYLFKITIVGPDDTLLQQVVNTINESVVAVNGIRIGSTDVETNESDVRVVVMSPTHAALDILLSFTYRGASAAMLVLHDPDPEMETKYRNEIREKIGTGYPTRVFYAGMKLTKAKRKELMKIFYQLVEEIVEMRTRKAGK